MSGPVTLEVRDGVAVVTIDNPPVNACSHLVRVGLVEACAAIARDPSVVGVVLACAGRTFVAGADIAEFGKPPLSPTLAEAYAAVEALEKPVVAVLHGTALGGGLELALACTYRVIAPDGGVGLPEVTLGIIPGAGGTQRLPRLVGAAAALSMIPTGRRVAAAQAMEIGLVDALTEGDRIAFALAFLRARLGQPLRRLSERPFPVVAPSSVAAARAEAARRLPGQDAPQRAIAVVADSQGRAFEAGMALEAETFAALRVSPQSQALRHLFFAERAVAKVPGLESVEPGPLRRIGVVGGGTMGAGIAAACLLAGLPVTLVERDATALAAASGRLDALLSESVRRGKLDDDRRTVLLADALRTATGWDALADADLVIEAVFEDMEAKRAVFTALCEATRKDAVLATNTSYLDVALIAAASPRPDQVIGLHFFSPAHVMKLVEVVVPTGADPRAVATGFALAKRLGKLAVRSGNAEGFIGNRILSAYRKAADYAVLDGASPWEVDAAMRAFGFPMGLYEMQDLAGLDIGWATRKRLASSRDPRERPSGGLADRLCEAGRFGRKTGRGFYDYAHGKPHPDPLTDALLEEERAAGGSVPRPMAAAEIERRIVAATVNEAARVLGEGVALRASDVDVVMANGYGFPRWRGGPLYMADAMGAPALLADIVALGADDPFFWRPAPLLVHLAETGGRFADLGH